MKIKFENWKSGKQAVIRNEKGKFITRSRVKGSGIRTKKEFLQKYKDTGSLSKSVAVLSKRVSRVGKFKEDSKENKRKLTIKGKDGSKTLTIDYERSELIGKNTALIKSKKPLKGQNHYQYIVNVRWGKEKILTTGYSDLKNNKGSQLQAFNRARSQAVELGILKYDEAVHITSPTTGSVTSPQRKTPLTFTYISEVGTYVRTTENFKTTKTKQARA